MPSLKAVCVLSGPSDGVTGVISFVQDGHGIMPIKHYSIALATYRGFGDGWNSVLEFAGVGFSICWTCKDSRFGLLFACREGQVKS